MARMYKSEDAAGYHNIQEWNLISKSARLTILTTLNIKPYLNSSLRAE